MEKLGYHTDKRVHLKLSQRHHVEELARHVFQNDPSGLKKVDRIFGENVFQKPEIQPVRPRDFTMHHIPQ